MFPKNNFKNHALIKSVCLVVSCMLTTSLVNGAAQQVLPTAGRADLVVPTVSGTTSTRTSTRQSRDAKNIEKIQKTTTRSSTTTLSEVPDAAGVVKTKICPRARLQYEAKSGLVHNLSNPQKFVGEYEAHNICFVTNGFNLDGFVPPTRAPETTFLQEQIGTYVVRHTTIVTNFAYTLSVGGQVYYHCQEDPTSKTPKWVLLRGCEVVVSEHSTETRTSYEVDSTPVAGGGGGGGYYDPNGEWIPDPNQNVGGGK